jgi:hypothetical protein
MLCPVLSEVSQRLMQNPEASASLAPTACKRALIKGFASQNSRRSASTFSKRLPG